MHFQLKTKKELVNRLLRWTRCGRAGKHKNTMQGVHQDQCWELLFSLVSLNHCYQLKLICLSDQTFPAIIKLPDPEINSDPFNSLRQHLPTLRNNKYQSPGMGVHWMLVWSLDSSMANWNSSSSGSSANTNTRLRQPLCTSATFTVCAYDVMMKLSVK